MPLRPAEKALAATAKPSLASLDTDDLIRPWTGRCGSMHEFITGWSELLEPNGDSIVRGTPTPSPTGCASAWPGSR
jgi:hypothetical protein